MAKRKLTFKERQEAEQDLAKFNARIAEIRRRLGKDETNIGLPHRNLALIQVPAMVKKKKR